MSDNWNFYIDELDGNLASFVVDLDVTEEINIKKYNWLFTVKLTIKSPTELGFPEEIEDELLGELEYDVMEKLYVEDIIQVGRLTTNGTREFFYYAKKEKQIKIIDKQALAIFDNNKYETEISSIEEEEPWSFYYDFLYPNEYHLQQMNNRDLVELLEQENDDLEHPREIQHWIEFQTLKDLKAFEQDIIKEGFKTQDFEQEKNEEGTFSITIIREDGVDYEMIDAVTYLIIETAQKYHGEYDGWESPVVLKK
ncbi:DUF695 domain-containing protein [Fictibacillus norfolkensis]|uniref:DUF695 domain-containing protein n=1 Tax=Fictibacillus norfolkensis TaxID=2762233 RepID=A0ABR8SKA2_9BACL|nr:DUF695 domain-containing protein [Fictibacillus norfolkensis]MBD7963870.1 DUF695 domain-containing protein [Fictibacillus norfolkensis]